MKWDAWNKVKGMSRVDASNKFIIAAKEILDEYDVNY